MTGDPPAAAPPAAGARARPAPSLVVEADGGSRGNPGPAGFGAVVRDAASGAVLAERNGSLGVTTNNVAEYQGLIAGLEAAREVLSHAGEGAGGGGAAVEVRMDSKLVVEQMAGRWKVKEPRLQKLAMQAHGVVRDLPPVRWTWIPRARNAHADRLANEAMDAAARDDRADHGGATSGADPASPATAPAGAPAGAATAVRRLPGWMRPGRTPSVTIVARHGATALSVEKRFSGRGDVPLSDLGRQQAEALAQRLAVWPEISAVVASPLARAQQTAGAVAAALGMPVDTDDDLAETDFGDWEGLTFSEVSGAEPDAIAAWLASDEQAPPGGESFAEVHRRVRRARDRLLAAYGGRTVVVVSHVTPIKSLVRLALHAPHESVFRMHVDLVSVSEIDWHADGPAVLRRFNDTGHWPPAYGH